MTLPLIYDLDLVDLKEHLAAWKQPAYRADQIWQGLYCKLWNSPDQFTNLPVSLRTKLIHSFTFEALTPIAVQSSRDHQTIKTLLRAQDGQSIEAVLMRYHKRQTLCISTQVGCAMGCVFCATGQMGFRRHLTSGEIVAQVLFYARQLADQGLAVTNIVLMGMGEPFHNYQNTLSAIDRLNDPQGYHFGARRITLSTVGLVPAIHRFSLEKRQVNLAISLHAAEDALRSSMLPVNKKYSLQEVLAASREYVAATGRRITFEWALIQGVNDTPEQAHRLARQLRGLLCHVNVIPLNPTQGYTGRATTRASAEAFRQILAEAGIPCTIRLRRGIDIQAGCGQLASELERRG
jgi:23S rRNA (adenine2503-C2)-methyltransferase